MNHAMNFSDAMARTTTVSLGIEARCVRRRDRRGRVWYLIGIRDKLFLVRQDRTGWSEVTQKFASQWSDWRPQSPEDAAREAAIIDTPEGLRFRNTMLGLALGPLPERPTVPDALPADF